MIIDYAYFGDFVDFDTTFGTNKEYRPFGVFLGLNQFRETTIFGAALLFDETKENYSPMVHYMVGEILEPVMMKMARLMKLKKPGVKAGE